ncbi:MAG: uracil-DNA glycosylase [Candidatus Eremiobacteraeota bacterium]|nr:uracil-DNA glycosylase [Candidatus Eremiobacteraeota bacterium]
MVNQSLTLAAIRKRIIHCTRCPELRRYCAEVARVRKRQFATERYWGKPVPNLGDVSARLLIVGLAPAAHGGNRTGRMFTGDGSADWLARSLFRSGFATQPHSTRRDDGYMLIDTFMTAAIRCAPPANKPTPRQIERCAVHLRDELDALKNIRVVVALGKIAFDTILRQLRARGYVTQQKALPFGHGAEYELELKTGARITLISSYHPSRQNTNTGKLSQQALDAVFARARALLRNKLSAHALKQAQPLSSRRREKSAAANRAPRTR